MSAFMNLRVRGWLSKKRTVAMSDSLIRGCWWQTRMLRRIVPTPPRSATSLGLYRAAKWRHLPQERLSSQVPQLTTWSKLNTSCSRHSDSQMLLTQFADDCQASLDHLVAFLRPVICYRYHRVQKRRWKPSGCDGYDLSNKPQSLDSLDIVVQTYVKRSGYVDEWNDDGI